MISKNPVLTAGVDLASKVNRTGYCKIEWCDNHARVIDLTSSLSDDQLTELAAGVAKLGIDVPLGWPTAFVEAVSMHSLNGSWPKEYFHAENEAYRYRQTDLWARNELKFPALLSVSTNLIAIPAMRAAAALSRLPSTTALDGSGVITEVYPAGALQQWGLKPHGYKGRRGSSKRRELVEQLVAGTENWLSMESEHVDLCHSDDNAFDALIAALVARAASLNLVLEIPKGQEDTARREGWIALPKLGSLQQLVS